MTTFKKGDKFIPHKPKETTTYYHGWTEGTNPFDGKIQEVKEITINGWLQSRDNGYCFHPDWCEKVGNSEIPNNHIPMKAGIEMISDEHIAENSGMDKFPIENHIKPFSQTNNHIPDVGKTIDWEQRRYELAKDIYCSKYNSARIKESPWYHIEEIKDAIIDAEEMIKQLKGE